MADAGHALTRDQVRADVLAIVHEKSRKLDSAFTGPVTDDTRIVGDLGFESVLIVELCTAVARRFQKKLPFQELVFQNDRFQDFSVGQLLAFLERHLSASPSAR